MVRVNGQQSEAVVTDVNTEAEGTIGMLFVDLDAPLLELPLWKDGQRVHVAAKWKPRYLLFPIHHSLIEILGSCSVQGLFVAHTYRRENRLCILLQSAGDLKPYKEDD